jgi:hypothetical protein
MRQHTRILGLCSALVGLIVAGATSAAAATIAPGAASTATPAGYSIVSTTVPLPNGAQTSGAVVCPSEAGRADGAAERRSGD